MNDRFNLMTFSGKLPAIGAASIACFKYVIRLINSIGSENSFGYNFRTNVTDYSIRKMVIRPVDSPLNVHHWLPPQR